MRILGASLEDTFAEAFPMRYVRLIITASEPHWLDAAVRELTGYSASVIACDAEIGLERLLGEEETPDGRVGAAVLAFGMSVDALTKAIPNRVGQCVMTCPTTAVFDGCRDAERRIPLGKHIRFFGDGFQKSKQVDGRRYWRIPVMDGEFVVEDRLGVEKGIGGGNVILQAERADLGARAAREAAAAIAGQEGVITPFPGGVVRSGSKVGSRYKGLVASTSDAFCPTLRGRTETRLHADANCAYEIVIDGVSAEAIEQAMRAAILAAARHGALAISAGNYGGKLGKYHFHLRSLMQSHADEDSQAASGSAHHA